MCPCPLLDDFAAPPTTGGVYTLAPWLWVRILTCFGPWNVSSRGKLPSSVSACPLAPLSSPREELPPAGAAPQPGPRNQHRWNSLSQALSKVPSPDEPQKQESTQTMVVSSCWAFEVVCYSSLADWYTGSTTSLPNKLASTLIFVDWWGNRVSERLSKFAEAQSESKVKTGCVTHSPLTINGV